MRVTHKNYKCDRCGTIVIQSTNHYGPTYSCGRSNVCPKCPPWAKYPEYGGSTTWTCVEPFPDHAAIEELRGLVSALAWLAGLHCPNGAPVPDVPDDFLAWLEPEQGAGPDYAEARKRAMSWLTRNCMDSED